MPLVVIAATAALIGLASCADDGPPSRTVESLVPTSAAAGATSEVVPAGTVPDAAEDSNPNSGIATSTVP
jgi:hypothetical protein